MASDHDIADDRIEKEGKELEIAKETQKLNWYVQRDKLWSELRSRPSLLKIMFRMLT